MQELNAQTLLSRAEAGCPWAVAPERVLQIGEGNFLRAFADDFIDQMNERTGFNGRVLMLQPRGDRGALRLRRQDCLYHVWLRGRLAGRPYTKLRLIRSVSRCLAGTAEDYPAFLQAAANPQLRFVISNTTEAGLRCDLPCAPEDRPPQTFPARLARFLYERWKQLNPAGQTAPGLIMLPCELNEHNGELLKTCVWTYARQWQLEPAFYRWLESENRFYATLVDRIVTGYSASLGQELAASRGLSDRLLVSAEPFALWVIQAPPSLEHELPLQSAGLPVTYTDDLTPYKIRKVRVLNGAHTVMAPTAYLAGLDIVRDSLHDPLLGRFIHRAIYQEILPTLDQALTPDGGRAFAQAVLERFDNPYIDHSLLAISLNTVSKWRTRVLPTLKDYLADQGQLPVCLTFSLAALVAFYNCQGQPGTAGGIALGHRGSQTYEIKDDPAVLDFFAAHSQAPAGPLISLLLGRQDWWGEDLNRLPGLAAQVTAHLELIRTAGMRTAIRRLEDLPRVQEPGQGGLN
ncbi:MAG: tagaturonate reductase [Oscillospiraceae bacterium]|nr:tagaturonate reductase [Oscillospiraceae bacterium]MDD4368676.1 tagaturonate reductase [Oscillospiraceae bacterium]